MIKIHKTKKGQFYVTYSAKNGEIVSTSEILKTKSSAKKNIKSMSKIMKSVIFPASLSGNVSDSLCVTDCTGDTPVKIWL